MRPYILSLCHSVTSFPIIFADAIDAKAWRWSKTVHSRFPADGAKLCHGKFLPHLSEKQSDQIWRIFTTLAPCQKTLAILKEFI